MYDRIVVCLDVLPTGERVAESAIEIAARFGSRLTFLTVVPKVDRTDPEDPREFEQLLPKTDDGRSIQQVLEEAQLRAKEQGVQSTERVLLQGPYPAEKILEHLAADPPDVVVVGTRNLSRGSRLLLGSVSTRVVTEAPCPVFVVRNVAKRSKS